MKGIDWSNEISIDSKIYSSTKGTFEVISETDQMSYMLSYSFENLSGFFNDSQLVVIMPRFCILNCMDETILVSQKLSEKFCDYKPYLPSGWHKLDKNLSTCVQLRTQSTLWSLGSVDLNEIGSSLLYIPLRNQDTTSANGIVVHIEVKLAQKSDNCSIAVIIWRESVESKTATIISNDSNVSITVRQADLELAYNLSGKDNLFDIIIPPSAKIPFGWADSECGTSILVAVGEEINVILFYSNVFIYHRHFYLIS
jgi:hypothetical protein